MVVNEDLILEIVQFGTGDPVTEANVGEIVLVCGFASHLAAILPGLSPCGRSNMRIKGSMGVLRREIWLGLIFDGRGASHEPISRRRGDRPVSRKAVYLAVSQRCRLPGFETMAIVNGAP